MQQVYFEFGNQDLDKVVLNNRLIRIIFKSVNLGEKTLIIVSFCTQTQREIVRDFIISLFAAGIAFNMNVKERQS